MKLLIFFEAQETALHVSLCTQWGLKSHPGCDAEPGPNSVALSCPLSCFSGPLVLMTHSAEAAAALRPMRARGQGGLGVQHFPLICLKMKPLKKHLCIAHLQMEKPVGAPWAAPKVPFRLQKTEKRSSAITATIHLTFPSQLWHKKLSWASRSKCTCTCRYLTPQH